jgi:hypothetical protein
MTKSQPDDTSINCWIPNSSGIIAKGRSVLAFVLLSAATPIKDSEVPAMKLAEAEKHIRHHPLEILSHDFLRRHLVDTVGMAAHLC